MLRIAIVEDDFSQARQLEEYTERCCQEQDIPYTLTLFRDGMDIADDYAGQFDLIYMDVQMKFLDGLETAKLIRKQDPEVEIVFVTATPQYAIEGYKVGALDYLLKPVSYFAFSQQLQKAARSRKSRELRSILLTTRDGIHKVDIRSIYYIEAMDHTLMFHTSQGEHTVRATLREVEGRLPAGSFFRCHNGFLVNLEHIESLQESTLRVHGTDILFSRSKRSALLQALTDYVGGLAI